MPIRRARNLYANHWLDVELDNTVYALDTGVICDQRVILNGFYPAKAYPEHLRRIRLKDPESGKTLVVLSNNTSLPALTIAALYKSCWQVELFFKWIKQHLRIKRFLGTSQNAVKTQVWWACSPHCATAILWQPRIA